MPRIIGGDASDILIGTRAADTIDARGGEDLLLGDGIQLRGRARGGNDALFGGSGDDRPGTGEEFSNGGLIGDAVQLTDHSRGGNDRLRGGTGSDHLYGDAGPYYP